HVELRLFEVRKDLPGSLGHGPGQAGQLRDVDSVAAVGPAGNDLAEEYDAPLQLLDGHRRVGHAGADERDLRQLVVVSREQDEGALFPSVVQVLAGGPG